MPCEVSDLRIEPLADHHLREAFSCGNGIIDRFVRKKALRDHLDHKVRVKVAVCGDDPTVVAFYSLGLKTLAPKSIIGAISEKFGNWPIPSVYLSMVGTDEGWVKKGIGTELMLDAFERTLEIADRAGTACMTLTAVDEAKANWYETLGLLRIEPDQLEMYIALGTLREACEQARATQAGIAAA